MGRTLPTITQVLLQEQESFSRFRRALRRSDQLVLDDLFAAAHQHLAAAAYASHALPFEVFLLAMLLEEHKEVIRLRRLVETLLAADQDYRQLAQTSSVFSLPSWQEGEQTEGGE
jgi:hypothetical protein